MLSNKRKGEDGEQRPRKLARRDLPAFHYLPPEILRRIALHLHPSEALQFSLVAPGCGTAAEPVIWRHVALRLSAHYGRRPLIAPVEREDKEAWSDWIKEISIDAENDRAKAIKARLDGLLRAATDRRLAYVKSLRIVPRRGANNVLVQVLDQLAPTLKRLELVAEHRATRSRLGIKHHETIGFKLLDMAVLSTPLEPITFKCLTHITLEHVLGWYDMLPMIMNLGPELIEADLSLGADTQTEWIGWTLGDIEMNFTPPDRPTYKGKTKLRRLYLSTEMPHHPDVSRMEQHISALLDASPDLELVNLNLPEWDLDGDPQLELIYYTLKDHANLKKFGYPAVSTHQFAWWHATDPGFASLEKLSLMVDGQPAGGRTPCIEIIPLPKLRVLNLIDGGECDRTPPGSAFNQATPVRLLLPDEAAAIRQAALLQSIWICSGNHRYPDTHFGDPVRMTTGGEPLGSWIFSYRHFNLALNQYDEELLNVRTYDRSILLQDAPADQIPYGPDPDLDGDEEYISTVEYTSATGEERRVDFIPDDKVVWEDATEYKGRMVPMAILRTMGQVSGMSDLEWFQRGVEVDDKVWKVLEDWYAEAE